MASSWALAEGDEIAPGRTAVTRLGGGHRYEVYLAFDGRLRALVVAKLVRPDQVGTEGAQRALANEQRLLDRLAHPMLLRSFGAELDGDRPQLLLEHIEGPRLSTLIRRFGVILEQLLPLALDLASVLHYLRGEGVVHLDVKPTNVIMAGTPRLIDLSVARTVEQLGEITRPVGTDAYMAPEQCDPALFDQLGPATDVWGLGATLYEAATRRRPFPGKASEHPQLRSGPEPIAEKVPPRLVELILACLERRPQDRPAPDQLGDALEPLVAALPPPRIGRFRPGGRAMERDLGA